MYKAVILIILSIVLKKLSSQRDMVETRVVAAILCK